MKQFLSHIYSIDTPGYGGQQGTFLSQATSEIAKGRPANSSEWKLSNHTGTHVDVPFHFFEEGQTIETYSAESWVFTNPHLIHRPAGAGELIGVETWCEKIPATTDLLLVKTGFEAQRGQTSYTLRGPGFQPELGVWLRENRPSLRMIGFDVISLTSYLHRPLGREAHRAFLNPHSPGQPILICEDMSLVDLQQSPREVWVLPIRSEKGNGGPVSVIASH